MSILDKPLPSSCYSRHGLAPSGVLLHFISARNTRAEAPYHPQACYDIFVAYGVSAHYLVLRSGEIWRMVPENRQAWHAGRSRFRGVSALNASFLGIELIGDSVTDYTDEQYDATAHLVRVLLARYRIPTNRVKGHEQVSGPDVRADYKQDPGPCFDWLRLGMMLAQQSAINPRPLPA